MRLRDAAASALHLLVVLCFLTLGALCLLLVRRPDWNQAALDCLEKKPETLCWIGAAFAALGVSFLLGFYGIGRGRYLRLEMRSGPVQIDSHLVRKAVEECFRRNYPQEVRGASVSVARGRRLEVALELAPLEEEQQLKLLSDAEGKLLELLRSQFGYTEPLTLFVRSR